MTSNTMNDKMIILLHVPVERVDDRFAIFPRRAVAVVFVAVGVAVTADVEPILRQPFAEMGQGQQPSTTFS